MYTIKKAAAPIALDLDWDAPAWRDAEVINIAHFHARSSDHRPRTTAKLLYDDRGVHVFFRVADRYVRCVHTHYQDPVCRDSCVEFFIQPKPDKGYLNVEFNCGGALLLFYIEDPTRGGPTEFKKATKVDAKLASLIQVAHSMPSVIEPEITAPTTWLLQYFVPFSVFEALIGPLGKIQGQAWRGNLYKCGDQTSHPHWASWSPIEELNFHQPKHFAPLRFE